MSPIKALLKELGGSMRVIAEEWKPEIHETRMCHIGGDHSEINHDEFMAACESAWEDGRMVCISNFRSDVIGKAVDPNLEMLDL